MEMLKVVMRVVMKLWLVPKYPIWEGKGKVGKPSQDLSSFLKNVVFFKIRSSNENLNPSKITKLTKFWYFKVSNHIVELMFSLYEITRC